MGCRSAARETGASDNKGRTEYPVGAGRDTDAMRQSGVLAMADLQCRSVLVRFWGRLKSPPEPLLTPLVTRSEQTATPILLPASGKRVATTKDVPATAGDRAKNTETMSHLAQGTPTIRSAPHLRETEYDRCFVAGSPRYDETTVIESNEGRNRTLTLVYESAL